MEKDEIQKKKNEIIKRFYRDDLTVNELTQDLNELIELVKNK